jgi:hypothetical protein
MGETCVEPIPGVGVGVRVGVAVRLGVGVFDGVAVLVVVGVGGLSILSISPQFDSVKIIMPAVMRRMIEKPVFLPMINLHPFFVAGDRNLPKYYVQSTISIYHKAPSDNILAIIYTIETASSSSTYKQEEFLT